MCEQCRRKNDADKEMWQAIRLGLIGMSRGLGAVVKAIEKRYADREEPRNVRRAA